MKRRRRSCFSSRTRALTSIVGDGSGGGCKAGASAGAGSASRMRRRRKISPLAARLASPLTERPKLRAPVTVLRRGEVRFQNVLASIAESRSCVSARRCSRSFDSACQVSSSRRNSMISAANRCRAASCASSSSRSASMVFSRAWVRAADFSSSASARSRSLTTRASACTISLLVCSRCALSSACSMAIWWSRLRTWPRETASARAFAFRCVSSRCSVWRSLSRSCACNSPTSSTLRASSASTAPIRLSRASISILRLDRAAVFSDACSTRAEISRPRVSASSFLSVSALCNAAFACLSVSSSASPSFARKASASSTPMRS